MKKILSVLIIAFGVFLLTISSTQAEWYMGGQVGYVKPNDLKNVEGVGSAKGIELSDLELKDALGYGVKGGYFFPGYMDWLGLQLEVFTANPHVKQQNVTAGFGGSSSPLGTLDGSHLRIITPAANVILRLPGYYVEPYLGPGIGLFIAKISDATGSETDMVPGANMLAGIRFYLNEHVALFTEYKYNYAKFKFNDSLFEATYSSHNLFGGLTYHF